MFRYPLVNSHILRTGKIHHAINGKIHELSMAIFHSFLYVHQRVSILESDKATLLGGEVPMARGGGLVNYPVFCVDSPAPKIPCFY